jgi:hypothetical protein
MISGIIMGAIMSISLLVENSACRSDVAGLVLPLLAWGAFGGLAGSLVGSPFTCRC